MNSFPMTRRARPGLAALFAVTLAALPALADEAKPREAVITVTGEGRAEIAPDMAIIELGVVKQAKTAREALDANTAAMREVLEALKSAGIAERDLQTSGFTINPQYRYPQSSGGGTEAPELTGFQVANTLTVRVRDLARLGDILDHSVTLGVNQGGGIRFTNDKPDAAVSDARRKAVEDAMGKAKELTAAAGVGLGRVLEISETMQRAEPMPMMRAMAKDFAAEAVPVAAGENSYTVLVNVTFALGEAKP